jgi:glycine/D-amino acid oxidase-like deaminating enzyme
VHVAVVGGGIVGTLTALLLAQRGHRVDLFERETELWAGASAVNEGKVHLGGVYALGGARTHEVMMRGAVEFAPCIEAAIGQRVDWDEVAGEEFDHLVMPDSLASVDDLRSAYAAINERAARVIASSDRYLGRRVDHVVDPHPHRDADTGLTAFSTRERAVDPLRLRAVVLEAIVVQSRIRILTSTPVTDITTDDDHARVSHTTGHQATSADRYDAAVNATWAWQNRFAAQATPRNFRVKTAVRLKLGIVKRSVTMVQGPYGDVVAHRDHGYASWYPTGRLITEHGIHPSARAEAALASIPQRTDLVRSQLDALAGIGLLPAGCDGESIGGIIVGDGAPDIDNPSSLLHGRPDLGVTVHGRIVTPVTFKFTTGPLAARTVATTIEEWA